MRTAICFYGLVGSKTDKNGIGKTLNPKTAFKLNKTNLIDINDADVFIHSWSIDSKDELEELYKPKVSIIQEQKDFSDLSKKIVSNISLKQKLKEIFLRVFNNKEYQLTIKLREIEAFRACSRWYSNMQTLKLKENYENKNNFKYDAVLVLRLDVGFYKPFYMKDYDLSKFYASNWNDAPNINNEFKMNFMNHNLGKGFLDFWFFSNSHNMDKFGKLYDNIEKYQICPHTSSYQHAVSNKFNIGYIFYRWLDHEMIRRKEYFSTK